MTDRPVEITAASIAKLDLPDDVKRILAEIAERNADANRAVLLSVTQQLQTVTLRLDRIQSSLAILLEALTPTLKTSAKNLPVAFSFAEKGDAPDLARAIVVADPIAQGFTLTQRDVGEALGLDQPTTSVLVRALGLAEEPRFAVTVRRGKKTVVNYHRDAIEGLRRRIADPPSKLPPNAVDVVKRAQRKLLLAPKGTVPA